MTDKKFRRTKFTCYCTYFAMASVFAMPPLLFMTFHQMYGISYTLLGSLVVINFCTQLAVDLIFSFFSQRFNIAKTVRAMPFITMLGLAIYALSPVLFGNHIYAGLAIGTAVFSVSAGLSEVLLSPLVAAMPSDNPDRDMSLLHSLYAWGVLTVVVISTVFFRLFGAHNWVYLSGFFACLPLVVGVLFCASPIPEINIAHDGKGKVAAERRRILVLCVVCIFFGSAAENVMTNWASGYIESALGISKTIGDIFGLALFAVFLGFGRTLYARYGKNITKVLLLGMAGATVCYIVAGLSPDTHISLGACILTGFCTSMLWPGTLILMEEKIPAPGVVAYALMAAGGDFGASVAPQLMGVVVEAIAGSNLAAGLSGKLMLTPEQIGMKTGMLITALFPFLGLILLVVIKNKIQKQK